MLTGFSSRQFTYVSDYGYSRPRTSFPVRLFCSARKENGSGNIRCAVLLLYSWRLSVMQLFVIHLFTKFEVSFIKNNKEPVVKM